MDPSSGWLSSDSSSGDSSSDLSGDGSSSPEVSPSTMGSPGEGGFSPATHRVFHEIGAPAPGLAYADAITYHEFVLPPIEGMNKHVYLYLRTNK